MSETMIERINSYLSLGGLFNPELMEHQKVSALIIDCKEVLIELKKQNEKLFELVKYAYDYMDSVDVNSSEEEVEIEEWTKKAREALTKVNAKKENINELAEK